MEGDLEAQRRNYGDDTVIPEGREYYTPAGTQYFVRKDTTVSPMSKFTKFMVRITFGLWKFGTKTRVSVVKEERLTPRD